MYYFILFQYTTMAVLFAIGRPWKQSIHTNWGFSGWAIICYAAALLSLLAANPNVFIFRDDVELTWSWRVKLLILAGVNAACNAFVELVAVPVLLAAARAYGARQRPGSVVILRHHHLFHFFESSFLSRSLCNFIFLHSLLFF
jgi:hypothetical protein